MEIRLQNISKKIILFLGQYMNVLIYGFIILTLSFFIYFFYTQVYSSIINPKEIDTNTIFAKKLKVNLDLFNKVIDAIQDKQNNQLPDTDIRNPFN